MSPGVSERVRCAWGDSSDDYRRYHDEEWGTVLHGDDALFERMSLEAFQSGLSWITILRKRETSAARSPGSGSLTSPTSTRGTSIV